MWELSVLKPWRLALSVSAYLRKRFDIWRTPQQHTTFNPAVLLYRTTWSTWNKYGVRLRPDRLDDGRAEKNDTRRKWRRCWRPSFWRCTSQYWSDQVEQSLDDVPAAAAAAIGQSPLVLIPSYMHSNKLYVVHAQEPFTVILLRLVSSESRSLSSSVTISGRRLRRNNANVLRWQCINVGYDLRVILSLA